MSQLVKADAVFEGGGVKGIGLVGALEVAEERGYQWVNVAGTSAGAIIASLVAANFTAVEIKAIMDQLDYRKLADRDLVDQVPIVGPMRPGVPQLRTSSPAGTSTRMSRPTGAGSRGTAAGWPGKSWKRESDPDQGQRNGDTRARKNSVPSLLGRSIFLGHLPGATRE